MSCSFCGGNSKKSGEHIYSSSVLRVFDDIAAHTHDPIRKVMHQSDPIIKDLCTTCNSNMSYLDTFAGDFSSRYCKTFQLPGSSLVVDSQKLKKWCLKTSANMERTFKRNRLWWKDYSSYFIDKETPLDETNVSIYIASWRNKCPLVDEKQLEGMAVKVLDFHDANVLFTSTHIAGLDSPKHSYSLKIGTIVFLVCIWEKASNKSHLTTELQSYGWEVLSDFISFKKDPYNMWTSEAIGMIHDPKKVYRGGTLVDI